MSHRIFFFIVVVICGLSLLSCDDLIEKDISKKQLEILSPPDSFLSENYSVLFWWNAVKGAQHYRLQIAQPSFSSIQSVTIDTLIAGDRVTIPLNPGRYEWRIRIENEHSVTPYITRTLEVDTNSNLNGETFFVIRPADGFTTNNSRISFSWQPFPYADSYEYVLMDEQKIPLRTIRSAQTEITDSLEEGSFYWKAKAINSQNNTATGYSAERALHVDMQPPAPPVLLQPQNNTQVTNPATLSWTSAADASMDSIIVASDSSFRQVVIRTRVTGQNSYTLTPLILNETYFWRIRSGDPANNWSTYSQTYRFTVRF